MTRIAERGRAILEIFAEAQEKAQLTDRVIMLTEVARQRKLETSRRRMTGDARPSLTDADKRKRQIETNRKGRKRIQAQIKALRAARKAAA